MKKILPLILFLFTSSVFSANTWQHYFGGSQAEMASKILATADGGYTLVGYTNSYGAQNNNVMIVHYDSLGNQMWQKVIGGNSDELALGAVQDVHGNIYITGKGGQASSHDGLLMKVSSSGTLIWSKVFGNTFENFYNSIIFCDDGNLLLSGNCRRTQNGYSNVAVTKIDTAGHQMWNTEVLNIHTADAFCAVNDGFGGFIIGGQIDQGNASGYFIHLDSQGDSLTSKQIDLGYFSWGKLATVIHSSSGEFVFSGMSGNSYGGYYLLKTDVNGNTLLYSPSPTGGSGYSINDIAEMPDSSYVLVGSWGGNSSVPLILHITSLGQLIRMNRFYTVEPGLYNYACFGKSMTLNADLSITICGGFRCSPYEDGMILKTDTNFFFGARPEEIITADQSVFCDSASVHTILHAPAGFLHKEWIAKTASTQFVMNASDHDSVEIFEAATYYCVVSNDDERIVSNPMVIYVSPIDTLPFIVEGPQVNECANGWGTSLRANTALGYTYEWTKDGVVIPNSDYYSIGQLFSGTYTVRVSNQCGSYTSAPTIVNTNAEPEHLILSHSTSGFCALSNGYDVIHASSQLNSNYTYKLYRNDTLLSGASMLMNLGVSGDYYIVTTTNCGIDTSNTITIVDTVGPHRPVLYDYSAMNTIKEHYSASGIVYSGNQQLGIYGSPMSTLTYQWYLNSSPISNAISSTYQATSPGQYFVRVMNACGTAYSDTVLISPLPFEDSLIIYSNSSCSPVGLQVPAFANSNIQWYHNGAPMAGWTWGNYPASDSGTYYCTFYSPYVSGMIASDTFYLAQTIPQNSIRVDASHGYCSGDTVFLSMTLPVGNWQWYRNGIAIPGATGQSYSAVLSGRYSCTVTQGTCVESFGGAWVVIGNPIIEGNHYICNGANLTLNFFGSGSHYQWYRNGVLLPADTLPSITTTIPGDYQLSLINSCGTLMSDTFQLHTNTVASGLNPAAIISICPGDSASFSLPYVSDWVYKWQIGSQQVSDSSYYAFHWSDIASNSHSLTTLNLSITSTSQSCRINNSTTVIERVANYLREIYSTTPLNSCGNESRVLVGRSDPHYDYQWMFNGDTIPGATNATYGTAIPGIYFERIKTGEGCYFESNKLELSNDLIVGDLAAFPGTVVCEGTTGTLILTTPATDINWFHDGEHIPNQTSSSLLFSESGIYKVTFIDLSGCRGIAFMAIKKNQESWISLITSPSANLCAGDSVRLNVVYAQSFYSNFEPIQWYRNGLPIASAANYTYYAKQSGWYKLYLLSETCNYFTDSIYINISSTPYAQISSSFTSICTGDSLLLSANQGPGNTYQWRRNGIPIAGATHAYFYASQAGSYSCGVQSPCGYALSNAILLSSSSQIASSVSLIGPDTLCEGSTFTLNVSSTGSIFKWNKNGIAIPGASASTYIGTNQGIYTCTSSNSCSSITSNSIQITYLSKPSSSIGALASSILCANHSIPLQLVSFNSDSYQWYENGSPLSGSVQPSISASTAGVYSCLMTNTCGSVFSDSITIIQGSPVPSTIGSIIGPDTICAGDVGIPYSVTPYSSLTTYNWNCTSLAYFNSGQGNPTVYADFPSRFSVGVLQVQAASMCGMGPIAQFLIHTDPTCVIHPLRQTSSWRMLLIEVYPNPSAGAFSLHISSEDSDRDCFVKVTDILGHEVLFVEKLFPNSDYNFGEAFPSGIYLLHVRQGDDVVVTRLVKL